MRKEEIWWHLTTNTWFQALVTIRLHFHICSLFTCHRSSFPYSSGQTNGFGYTCMRLLYTVNSQSHLFAGNQKENVNDDAWKVRHEPQEKGCQRENSFDLKDRMTRTFSEQGKAVHVGDILLTPFTTDHTRYGSIRQEWHQLNPDRRILVRSGFHKPPNGQCSCWHLRSR